MNSARWLSDRALFTLSRSMNRSQGFRPPPITSRKLTILPSHRLITPKQTRLSNSARSSRSIPSSAFRQTTRNFRANGSRLSSNPTPNLGSPEPAPSLSQRLRKLSREYGWSALGVYFALSALDFPFCFLAVRLLGTDRIGRWEHAVIGAFWDLVRIPFPDFVNQRQAAKATQPERDPKAIAGAAREGAVGWNAEMVQAERDNKGSNASTCTDYG